MAGLASPAHALAPGEDDVLRVRIDDVRPRAAVHAVDVLVDDVHPVVPPAAQGTDKPPVAGEPSVARATVYQVVAGVAGDGGAVAGPVDRVVARAACHGVAAGAAEEDVVAVDAVHVVVAAPPVEAVVAV